MSNINFIIAQKEDLKSLIYQWLDEHPHFLFQAGEKEKESDKPMSRAEIAEYLGISKLVILRNKSFTKKPDNQWNYPISA